MKVIVRPPEFKNFPLTCTYCEAQLEVEENDIEYYCSSDQRDGTTEYFFVYCLVCSQQLQVADRELPLIVRNHLKKAKRGW